MSRETIRHMTGCPIIPEGRYFTADIPEESQFSIPLTQWEKLRGESSKKNRLHSSWSTVMKGLLRRKCNGYCVFTMLNHSVTVPNSRKRSTEMVFKAKGRCIFKDCFVTVNLQMSKENARLGVIDVFQSGSTKTCHKRETLRTHKG